MLWGGIHVFTYPHSKPIIEVKYRGSTLQFRRTELDIKSPLLRGRYKEKFAIFPELFFQ